MSTKLTITNLKNISSLNFEIPSPGAYLLTGTNGSGKTTLLTCLSRLRNSGAFQKGFRSSANPHLDSHRGASVRYEIDNDLVTYTYVEERWAPLPRRNSGLLAKCGFPEVTYIAADGDRVEPKKDEFSPRRVKLTEKSLRNYLNEIFDTERFNDLCYINLTRGGQNRAYLIRQTRPGKQTLYFSEKNFSLGELCVLKLLLSLENMPDQSLVLIDELELAVHPRAQTKLFQHLEKLAAKKKLTIIFSTHSVTLIKTTERKKILFLQNINGIVNCIKGCYPTFALGQISSGEEISPDCVIYVEDDSAKKCVESMLLQFQQKYQGILAQPTVVTVSIGGFKQILEFLDKAPALLPATTKIKALLDEDVKSESLVEYRSKNDHYMLGLFDRLNNNVNYLPWTPEVGFIDFVSEDLAKYENGLKDYYSDQRISFPAKWPSNTEDMTSKKIRDARKKDLYVLCEHISALIGKPNDRIREGLFDYFVRQCVNEQQYDLVELISEVIHR
jgi:energy-coupling factor transporter ATP-binding protein EcfA2